MSRQQKDVTQILTTLQNVLESIRDNDNQKLQHFGEQFYENLRETNEIILDAISKLERQNPGADNNERLKQVVNQLLSKQDQQ